MTQTAAGRVLLELIGQSQTDAKLRAAMNEHYSGPRRELAVEAMRRGQAAGQLRRDVVPSVVVDQLWGAVYHRSLLSSNLPIDIPFADALLDNIWKGIAADADIDNTGRGPQGR